MLVENGADVNAVDSSNNSVLICAIRDGKTFEYYNCHRYKCSSGESHTVWYKNDEKNDESKMGKKVNFFKLN